MLPAAAAATMMATRFMVRDTAMTASRAMRQVSSRARQNSVFDRATILTGRTIACQSAPPPGATTTTPVPNRDSLLRSLFGDDVHDKCLRRFSSSSSSSESLCPKQIQVRLNEFQELFVEARMCIDDVKDSYGTVYYEDDADDAREAVESAIKHFEALLREITDIDEKNKVLRSNGLKVEQLKGELELTLSGGHDH